MLLINKYLALDWPVVVPDKSGNTGVGVSPETIIVLIVVIRFWIVVTLLGELVIVEFQLDCVVITFAKFVSAPVISDALKSV